jgi:hypothetical protein
MAWVRIVAVSGAKAPELHGYLCGTAEAVPFRSKVYETRSREFLNQRSNDRRFGRSTTAARRARSREYEMTEWTSNSPLQLQLGTTSRAPLLARNQSTVQTVEN